MKITIEFDSPEQAVSALRGIHDNTPPVPVHTTHAQPLRAPAAYAPPQPVHQAPQYQPPQPANNGFVAPQVAPTATGITSGQVAAAAQAYAKVHGPKGAKAKLAEFNITKIIEAQPHQYPALLQAFAV